MESSRWYNFERLPFDLYIYFFSFCYFSFLFEQLFRLCFLILSIKLIIYIILYIKYIFLLFDFRFEKTEKKLFGRGGGRMMRGTHKAHRHNTQTPPPSPASIVESANIYDDAFTLLHLRYNLRNQL